MKHLIAPLILLGLVASAAAGAREPFASSYVPRVAEDVVFRGASVLTGTGEALAVVDVRLSAGRIAAIGPDLPAAGARVVDAAGMWLTPGIIDVHSHLGDYPSPAIAATRDGNEATDPNTAQVWAEHSVWPQDSGFARAMAGGITALQVLPGSANLFGGRSVTLKKLLSSIRTL